MTVEAISHHFSDGVYAKQMMLKKGHAALTHRHSYGHLSILAQGEVDVVLDGVKTRYKAPSCIEIKAGTHHAIVAHEDSVFFCIHATNETEFNDVMIEKIED